MRDTSYRDRIGKKIPIKDLIPKHIYKKKNEEKSWEFREYPEFDQNFICISKDGTLGDIYFVYNLYIGLPSSIGKEIINEGLEGEDAVWNRKPPPQEFEDLWFDYKHKMSKEKGGVKRQNIRNEFVRKRKSLTDKYSDFIDSEFDKREQGVFVKIDNEVHYFTGENWLFLQHYFLTESDIYPNFRLTQTEAYWHWEACVADTRNWGEIRGKGRRTSWSVESASMALNTVTLTKYAEIPIVSERKDLAEKLFQGKIVKSFEYYPIYFKPLILLPNDEPKKTLTITHETRRKESGSISFYPTKATAYDSTKVKDRSINDEIGKWEDESLTDFISRHSKCHTQGGGKGRFGSTAGEYFKGGGQEFEVEFKSADPNKRNYITGRTENGLINFFIDICYTMTEPMNFFDKWGYSIVHDPKTPIYNEENKIVEVGAVTYWNATFNSLKELNEKKKLNGFLRDSPRTIEHMFRNEGGIANDFDIANLNDHTDYLNSLNEFDYGEIIFRGNFAWKGEPYKSDVEWRPNTKGKFFTTWIPDKKLQNKSSIKKFHGKDLVMPDNNHIGCFGIDSYDISKTADGKGSNGALMGYTKFNMTGAPCNSFFLKYAERPDKRDDFYDDMIKVCKFYGMYALIESNKPRLLEYFKDNGFRGYSMTRPDKKWKDLSDFEKEYGGIPSSKQTNKDQAGLLKDYIFDYIGQNVEKDCKIYFLDVVEEWKKFDVNNRTKFDLSVAGQLALLGSQYNPKQRKSVPINSQGGLSIHSFGA